MVQPPAVPVIAAGAHLDGTPLVPPSPLPPSTKEQLVITAERLFAVHGIDSVSLRQICTEAGNANNSAVQYHFGTKDRLLQAIFEYRIPHLMARRNLLAAEASAGAKYDDIRTALMVQFLPLVEQAETEGSYYLGFVTQLNHQRAGDHPYWRLPADYRTNVERYRVHLHELLPNLPPALRWHRIQIADAACTQACAAREQARYLGGTPTLPYGFHLEALFDALTGILTAPVSPTAAKVAATLDLGDLAPFYPDIKPPYLESQPTEQ